MSDIKNIAALTAAAYAASKILGKKEEAAPNVLGSRTMPAPVAVSAIGNLNPLVIPYLEELLYGDCVFYDSTAGGGVFPPAGSVEYPCKTLNEVRLVLAARKLHKVFLLNPAVLDADMQNLVWYSYTGLANTGSPIQGWLDPNGFSVDGGQFLNTELAGVMHAAANDFITAENSYLEPQTNPCSIFAKNCVCSATIWHIGLGDVIELIGCGAPEEGIASIIFDFTGCTIGGAQIQDWRSGQITIDNMTDPGTVVNITGRGQLVINASCTAGTITVGGEFIISNNSGGTIVNDNTVRGLFLYTLAGIIAQINQIQAVGTYHHDTKWGSLTHLVQVANVPADKALPGIIVAALPPGAVVKSARLDVQFGAVQNTSVGVNKINGNQVIQIKDNAGGGWCTAITIPDDAFSVSGLIRIAGNIIHGDINIGGPGKPLSGGNAAYVINWSNASSDSDFLQFQDVQTSLHIEYQIV